MAMISGVGDNQGDAPGAAAGTGFGAALRRFREGGQRRAVRDLGLDGFPRGNDRPGIAHVCCRHGHNRHAFALVTATDKAMTAP
jgi:hypothetical protein